MRAAALAIELLWSAPVECPDAASARVRLAEQLHGQSTANVRARVDIVESDRGWTATIAIDAGEPFAPRTLVASDCGALARAAVLVIAVAVDPIAVVGDVDELDALDDGPTVPLPPTRGAGPWIDTTSSTESRGDPRMPTATRRVRDRDMPSQHALRIAGGVGYEVVPALSGIVQLGYVLARPRWRFEAIASYVPPVEYRYDDGTRAGGRVQALSFGARACPTPRIGRVVFPICFGLEGGPVFGAGLDVARTNQALTGWLAAEAGLGIVVKVHRVVGIALGTEVLATLARPAFHVGSRETLFQAPIVGGRVLAGLEFVLR